MMALVSIAICSAQEGESTKEGVPIVEEIVSDSNVSASNGVYVPNTSRHTIGSWSVTYTNDTLNADEALDLLEAFLDEEFPAGLEGMLKTMMGAATGGLILVALVLFGIFVLPIILIVVVLYFIYKNRRAKYDAYKSMAESGQSIPQEELRQMSEPLTDRTLFNKGVRNVCLGIGLAIFLGIWMGDFGVGIGILVACIGIGELLVNYFSKK